ncbi:MAG: HK97 family phage prohead protease [Alphaproteobacteria bacterium]|nr:HK97 family phage prohead protease [Alphaproteobacteria bacterium]
MRGQIVVEGYAALFGTPDMEGDVVRAGAFRESLKRRPHAPMLLQHEPRLLAGVWSALREDARGLFVRGRIDPTLPGAARARAALGDGVDGLSIGFVAVVSERTPAGRVLIEVELLEVSIVAQPMQPQARLIWREAAAIAHAA